MNYYLDCEFNDFGGDLISLALVREDGETELHLATICDHPTPWVAENVLPIVTLDGAIPLLIAPDMFGRHVAMYLGGDPCPVIITDWPDDIRYFCAALITGPGEMVNIPRLAFELLRVDAYPTTLKGAVQHNALWDARALRHLFTPASRVPDAPQNSKECAAPK